MFDLGELKVPSLRPHFREERGVVESVEDIPHVVPDSRWCSLGERRDAYMKICSSV